MAGPRLLHNPLAYPRHETPEALLVLVEAEGHSGQRQAPGVPVSGVQVDEVFAMGQGLREDVQVEGPGVIAAQVLLVRLAPPRPAGRYGAVRVHRGARTAGGDAPAPYEAEAGVIEVVPVEVVHANGGGAGADEAVDDPVIKQARGPDSPVGHDGLAHHTAGVGQTPPVGLAIGP